VIARFGILANSVTHLPFVNYKIQENSGHIESLLGKTQLNFVGSKINAPAFKGLIETDLTHQIFIFLEINSWLNNIV
jgi:hypothetical protein